MYSFLPYSLFPKTVVLKAVNLGEDIDTTEVVTGGLAGIYYGIENLPNEWIEVIARKDDLVNLATRLETAIAIRN
ncbi:ADP-ribosylglycohydrolase family protein [Okeania sp. SIO1I7]|uniref:ADP-ribosylglycohydrolase family protein n=1 Tax=Okeania sp. SIO1I7 TaxID=2607772 RepID=UPI0025FAF897|nr:ADP-ribosylglycohydrolase family protein [Okeania sp. SIO1I7]